MKLFNYIGDLLSGSPEDYAEPTIQVAEMADLPQCNIINQSVNGNDILNTGVKLCDITNIFYEATLIGAEITPVGTIDPTNISTNEANLINNNYTDLVYHNNSQGSANKELPGIDLGSSVNAAIIRVYWWNNTYTASNYKVQGSNNGTTWTDLAINLDSTGLGGAFQDVSVSGSFRYYRVFCVTGTNTTWCVISELEAFAAGSTIYQPIAETENIKLLLDASDNVVIQNDNAASVNIKIGVRI